MSRPTLSSTRLRTGAVLAVAATTALALSGCGGDDPEPTAGTTSSTQPAETTPAEETTTPPATPDETEPAETTTAEETTVVDDAVVVEATIAGNEVTTTSDRVVVTVGQTLRITVTSDVDDELHVHGFDDEAALPAGQAVTIEIEVGTTPGPGLYEVETHDSGLLLFQVEVR